MEEHRELIARYNSNNASVEDLNQIERLLESSELGLDQLNDISAIRHQVDQMVTPESEKAMDEKFFSMLADQKRGINESPFNALMNWWNSLWQVQMQWAYSLALVLVGAAAVYVWQGSSDQKLDQLTAEMGEMKEVMMLSMIEQNSPTERLKAVSLTSDMGGEASEKVANALIEVLRHDENNNVRLAAVEALAIYTDDPTVRQEIIGSISYQESPLVQLALAELMVAIKEKKSVKEFKPIIDSDNTPDEVKVELQKAMQTLI